MPSAAPSSTPSVLPPFLYPFPPTPPPKRSRRVEHRLHSGRLAATVPLSDSSTFSSLCPSLFTSGRSRRSTLGYGRYRDEAQAASGCPPDTAASLGGRGNGGRQMAVLRALQRASLWGSGDGTGFDGELTECRNAVMRRLSEEERLHARPCEVGLYEAGGTDGDAAPPFPPGGARRDGSAPGADAVLLLDTLGADRDDDGAAPWDGALGTHRLLQAVVGAFVPVPPPPAPLAGTHVGVSRPLDHSRLRQGLRGVVLLVPMTCADDDDEGDGKVSAVEDFRVGDLFPFYAVTGITTHVTRDVFRTILAEMGGGAPNLPPLPPAGDNDRLACIVIERTVDPLRVPRALGGGYEAVDIESLEFHGLIPDRTPPPLPPIYFRPTSDPYYSCAPRLHAVLTPLLDSLATIRKEAQYGVRPGDWAPWPEDHQYNDGGGGSWTVYPFCYTFPANDPSRTTWIDKTCASCPYTAAALQKAGPRVRTALFSRLGAGTRLGTHTGWADLANHVLRVHIPLVIPPEPGACGTWVDGTVCWHDSNEVVVFDDSKPHRAFNNSAEDRIVLIVDIARPEETPKGTSVGGHTDELDAFIRQLH